MKLLTKQITGKSNGEKFLDGSSAAGEATSLRHAGVSRHLPLRDHLSPHKDRHRRGVRSILSRHGVRIRTVPALDELMIRLGNT